MRAWVAAVVIAGVLAGMPWPSAWAQTGGACPPLGGLLTPATVGTLVLRDGVGLGAVTLGSASADVVRAWGPPTDCRPKGGGLYYGYELSDDGGQTSVLILVDLYKDRVDQIIVMLHTQSSRHGPAVRTGRGTGFFAPVSEVERAYGVPSVKAQVVWLYTADGVGFQVSKQFVAAILIYSPGGPPPDWNPSERRQ